MIKLKPPYFGNFCFIGLRFTAVILYKENADKVAMKVVRNIDSSELSKIPVESQLLFQFASCTRQRALPPADTATRKRPAGAVHVGVPHQ